MTSPIADSSPRAADLDRLRRLLGYLAADASNDALRTDVFDTALAAGVFDEAQRQAVWGLTRNPLDFGWRHRLVLLDMARQEWDEAGAILISLKDEGQGGAVVDYNLACVDAAQGRLADAEARLRVLVASPLEQVQQSLGLLLSCMHRRGAAEDVVAMFVPLAAQEGSASAFGSASLAALDAGDTGLANSWADRSLALDPTQAPALVAKATLLIGSRQSRAALELLARVLAKQPDDGRALSAAAMAEMLDGRLQHARALFARSVLAMPEHIGTWVGNGWCSVFLHDLIAARTAFERALALDGNFGESHGAIAVVDALEGHVAQAEAGIRRALGLDPRGLAAQYAQAVLAGEQQNPQRFLDRAAAALGRHSTADGRKLSDAVLAPRVGT